MITPWGLIRRMALVVLVLFVVSAELAAGGFMAALALVVGWAVVGYLLWRAWPGVRSDLARLPSLRWRRGFRFRQRGSEGAL